MHLPRRPMLALSACWLLTSCASSTPPVSAPPRLLLAALLVLCPPPPPRLGPDMDALTVDLKRSYDAYGACAGLHAGLVQWLEREQGRQP